MKHRWKKCRANLKLMNEVNVNDQNKQHEQTRRMCLMRNQEGSTLHKPVRSAKNTIYRFIKTNI